MTDGPTYEEQLAGPLGGRMRVAEGDLARLYAECFGVDVDYATGMLESVRSMIASEGFRRR